MHLYSKQAQSKKSPSKQGVVGLLFNPAKHQGSSNCLYVSLTGAVSFQKVTKVSKGNSLSNILK